MTEILTQKDIDALLLGGSSDPRTSAVEVIPYDFARPPSVSRDRRATLESVHARFALSLQALLTSRLRTPIDVVLISVEQVAFSEWILSLASPCATFVFTLGDRVGGSGAIDLGSDLSTLVVDRLFGGPGESSRLKRALTPLEQTVVKNIADRMLSLLRDSWQDQLPIEPSVTSFESDRDMLQIANREDHVLVASLEARSEHCSGAVTLCLPMASLEPFLHERAPQTPESRREAGASRPLIAQCLQHARLTVTARLPLVWLSTREISELTPGQVLHTGHAIDTPIEVHVNGRIRFAGSLGQVRRRVGLSIAQRVSTPIAQRPSRAREGRVQ